MSAVTPKPQLRLRFLDFWAKIEADDLSDIPLWAWGSPTNTRKKVEYMDLEGTWITRDGRKAVIEGPVDDGVQFFGRVEGIVPPLSWSAETGNSHDSTNLDLVQRISGFAK